MRPAHAKPARPHGPAAPTRSLRRAFAGLPVIAAASAFAPWANASGAAAGAPSADTPRVVAASQFDPALLAGRARDIDLSIFERGNPVLAGEYRADVYLNGAWQGRHDLDFRRDADGVVRACLPLATIEAFGIDTGAAPAEADPSGCRAIHDWVPGASERFEVSTLRYDLSIPQVGLRRLPRGYVSPSLWDQGIDAGFLSYRISALDTSYKGLSRASQRSGYLGLGAGLNLHGWQLRHDSNLQWRRGDGRHWESIATYVQRGIAPVRGLLTLGDAHTSGEMFDSIGYRGVSLVTDDRMLPDSLRGYAPVVRGIAETNAQVEIRQNGQLIHSVSVAPGDFLIDDLYPTGYGGDLEVAVLEADGRRREFSVPYGAVPQLLRQGISRYAFTLGEVRDQRLIDAPWLLQATYQRGVRSGVTLYGGSTLSDGYASLLYGLGLSSRIGALALDVTHARTRIGRDEDERGAAVRMSYSHLLGPSRTHLALAAYRYSTVGFFDLRDALVARDDARRGLDPASRFRQRSQVQATLNQPLGPRGGALYLTGSVRDFYDSDTTSRQYQFGYNNAWRSLNYGVSVLRTEDDDRRADTQYLLSLSMPLGRSHPLSVHGDISRRDGDYAKRIGLTGSLGIDNAFTYGATLSDSPQGGTAASVNAEYRASVATLSASYGEADDYRQATVGAAGSVFVHSGGLTLAPRAGETMILVEAPAARGARLTNAPGLRVDRRGYAVVPYATPYRMNKVTLDPTGMSRDVELDSSTRTVAPYAGAIAHVRFETRSGRALLIDTATRAGSAPPFGAQVEDAHGQPVGMVGQGGRLYVRSPGDRGTLTVRWGPLEHQQCRIDYAVAGSARDQDGPTRVEAPCR